MTEIIERGIKDLIAEHPAIGGLLEREGISCVTCQAGTCRTRDIIEVHGLSVERERSIIAAIAAVVYPGRVVEIPTLPRAAPTSGALAPPLRVLVDEHLVIKRWLALVPTVAAALRAADSSVVEAARIGLRFLREYADHFHHAKEEETLFPRFDPEPETVRSMKAEHVTARGCVRDAAAALDAGQTGAAADALLAHGELLADHIRKEDEILFPWMNGRLATAEVGRLYAAIADIERAAADLPARLLADIEALEVRFRT
jgi:hemerythrin-like domain-containing protein